MRPERAADQVLSEYWDKKLPVNPIIFANAMGVSVYFDPSLSVSGQYQLLEDGSHAIILNPNESLARQRFTLLHELGHYFLGHGPSDRDQNQMFNQYHYKYKEVEANKFAAELLMPREAMRFYLESKGLGLYDLAEKFGVSETAMRIRLERLGYL